jgi:hypothetical protein
VKERELKEAGIALLFLEMRNLYKRFHAVKTPERKKTRGKRRHLSKGDIKMDPN